MATSTPHQISGGLHLDIARIAGGADAAAKHQTEAVGRDRDAVGAGEHLHHRRIEILRRKRADADHLLGRLRRTAHKPVCCQCSDCPHCGVQDRTPVPVCIPHFAPP